MRRRRGTARCSTSSRRRKVEAVRVRTMRAISSLGEMEAWQKKIVVSSFNLIPLYSILVDRPMKFLYGLL